MFGGLKFLKVSYYTSKIDNPTIFNLTKEERGKIIPLTQISCGKKIP